MITREQEKIVLQYVKALHPVKVGVFGSYARNQNSKESDLDILVYLDYSHKISWLDLIDVELKISDALGIQVDLVTAKSLHPLILPEVEKEVKFLS